MPSPLGTPEPAVNPPHAFGVQYPHQAMVPWVVAMKAIDAHFTALGGDASWLGPAASEVTACPDGVGFFRHHQGGSIYFTPKTGAHEVHGAIRDHWAELGWERSGLGYPVTDETPTPDGTGRFNHFQWGSIYWSPATGAREVHGDIRGRWAELGWEQSWLGYPVSDEFDFVEGGRISIFQHGAIYWWPDSGPIDLRGVSVQYRGIACVAEETNDSLSDSDEPYVVMGVNAPGAQQAYRSIIYDDVDSGETRAETIEIYRGQPGGLVVNVQMMEHDDGDPDKYKQAMASAVGTAATALGALVAFIPVVGPIITAPVSAALTAVAPSIADELNAMLDTGDDTIGRHTLGLSARDLVQLAARASSQVDGSVSYKIATPRLSAFGASYRVYFSVEPN